METCAGAYKRRVSTAKVPTLLDASPRVLDLCLCRLSSLRLLSTSLLVDQLRD